MAAAAPRLRVAYRAGHRGDPLGLEARSGWPRTWPPSTCSSGGRISPGISVGTPMLYDRYKAARTPAARQREDFSKERVFGCCCALRGGRSATSGAHWASSSSPARGSAALPRAGGGHVWYSSGRESAIWSISLGRSASPAMVGGQHQKGNRLARTSRPSGAAHFVTYRTTSFQPPKKLRVSQVLVVVPTESATADRIGFSGRLRREPLPSVPRHPRRAPAALLFSPTTVRRPRPQTSLTGCSCAPVFQRAGEIVFALPIHVALKSPRSIPRCWPLSASLLAPTWASGSYRTGRLADRRHCCRTQTSHLDRSRRAETPVPARTIIA